MIKLEQERREEGDDIILKKTNDEVLMYRLCNIIEFKMSFNLKKKLGKKQKKLF